VAGPTNQSTNTIIIPPGEGRHTYSATALAWTIQNFETTMDGTIKSVVGPAILRIMARLVNARGSQVATGPDALTSVDVTTAASKDYWNSDRPHSVFHASLQAGSASQLLYRFGRNLYRFRGDKDEPDEVVQSGLSTSSLPDYPDQYVVLQDNIIWTNGVDRARIISPDGSAGVLGYTQPAAVPTVFGPSSPQYDEMHKYFPNSHGYSWPGRIGTPGDVLAGRDGALLAGRWRYFVQYEDIYGNLSPFSGASTDAVLRSNQSDPMKEGSEESLDIAEQSVEIDDLTRRFMIKTGGDAPDSTVAVHLYRTSDTLHTVDHTPRLVARIPGSHQVVYDDNKSDSDLGGPWREVETVPIFRVACSHQGRLVIGNVPGDPGIVRQSEPGFAGTFLKQEYIYPDSGGAEVTALASHNNALLAFTETCVYSLADFGAPQPLSQGVGCVAPRSIHAMADGTLIWLGRDGFYGMRGLGNITRLSSPIDKIMRRYINRSRMRVASATYDAESGEYRCVLAPAGTTRNTLMFCFDGQYWRRQDLGIHFADICSTDDWRQYTLAIGTDQHNDKNKPTVTSGLFNGVSVDRTHVDLSRIFVLNRQTADYFAPPRTVVYRSNWVRASEDGLIPTNVRSLYIGMMDAWDGAATVRLFRNGSWKPYATMDNLRLVGPDDESNVVQDIAGRAIVGKARAHEPRLFWREVPVDIQNANSWAFEIEIDGDLVPRTIPIDESTYNLSNATDKLRGELGRIHIAAFAFDISVATLGTPRGRVPKRDDR
jgi:hypothetical protein